jgi:hypothetical protein
MKGVPIQVDPIVDDNEIHIEMCKYFLAGQRGLDLKKTAPDQYMMIEQHLQQHLQLVQQNAEAEQEKRSKAYVDTKAEAEVNKQAVKVTAKPILDAMEPPTSSNGAR